MTTQVFPNDTPATSDKFVIITMQNKPFSITFDKSAISGGSPTYTLSVCNKPNAVESDFIDITAATSLALTVAYESDKFNYSQLGVKFRSGSATGIVNAFLNVQNP